MIRIMKIYKHALNRGNDKKQIFRDDNDYARFLFLILFLQSPISIPHPERFIKKFIKTQDFQLRNEVLKNIIDRRTVELISFALMPNHFHLLLEELDDGGISYYMHRIQNAYVKYFNAKYERSGHLFQGNFKSVGVTNNNQFLYLSSYIHKNPKELHNWNKNYENYKYSSYQDFIKDNRWKGLLNTEIILEQFKSKEEYRNFVSSSIAKEDLEDIFIDSN